ncbi:MAG: DUF4390 domain-containing protein [Desulfobacteraceae bacterium]|nr:DUF4390 domain-containing protein [Desulfobacteraceae bacterium]MCF8093936.1 DUF4390 domain-containing protein [Desulfobacteraceae bacterium]
MAKRCLMIKLFAVFLLLAAAAPAGLYAQQARLTDMVAGSSHGKLLFFVKVEGAFTEKMRQAILNGIPTSFSFIIVLEKINPLFLPNNTLAEKRVTHTVKYETLKKQFTVKRSRQDDNQTLTTDSFEEVRQWMSEIKSLPIAPIKILEKNNRYRIRARAELDKVELPFYLDYIFFFVSLWDFKTDWHNIEFVY